MTAAIALAVLEAFGPARRAHAGAEVRARIYAAQVELAATAARIDPYLVVALIERESSWEPYAVGDADDRGLMQVREAAWKAVGPRNASFDAAFKVPLNIRTGTHWMAVKRKDCRTADPLLWLSAYHGGACRPSTYSRAIVARAVVLRGLGARLVAAGRGR